MKLSVIIGDSLAGWQFGSITAPATAKTFMTRTLYNTNLVNIAPPTKLREREAREVCLVYYGTI